MSISSDIKLLIEDVVTDTASQHKGKLALLGAGTLAYHLSPHFANAVDDVGSSVENVGKSIVKPIGYVARKVGLMQRTPEDYWTDARANERQLMRNSKS